MLVITEKQPYPFKRLVNWYHGNFCTRKCFNKGERISDCYQKFRQIHEHNKNLMMTHREFKQLIDTGDITICKLSPAFRRKSVSWKQFEKCLKDPEFDPDRL